jgi:hypothetical protein
LATHGTLCTLDRINRLLDGLSDEHRKKFLSFCAKNKWKLAAQDIGMKNPDFEELKQFVLREAQISQMQVVYNKEQTMREGQSIPEISKGSGALISGGSISAIPPSAVPAPPASPISAPSDPSRVDSMEELAKQMAKLFLSMRTIFQNLPDVGGGQLPPTTGTSRSPNSRPSSNGRPFRCI